jgi:UDP-glucose 4-epimerase
MKVVVTGGAGFIGSNLCAHLSTTNGITKVIAVDDLATGFVSNLHGIDVDFAQESILNGPAMATLLADADAVVHLAARPSVPRSIADPTASHRVNTEGTLSVLEACRASGRHPLVIFAGSSSVYGANPILPKVETLVPMPRSPYAATKLAGESYVRSWTESFGIPSLVFRFFNVFGPRQRPDHDYAAVVPAFLAAALRNEPLPIHSDGTQSRDFTYVATVAEVIATAITHKITAPTPVNLAFGTRVSLLSVVSEIETLIGHPVERKHLPVRDGDVAHSQADNTLLRSLFPSVVPVDLVTGLRTTLDWMKAYLADSSASD